MNKNFFSVIQNYEIGIQKFNLVHNLKNQISKHLNSATLFPCKHTGPILNLSIDLVEQK
jgi:hypothetical protein